MGSHVNIRHRQTQANPGGIRPPRAQSTFCFRQDSEKSRSIPSYRTLTEKIGASRQMAPLSGLLVGAVMAVDVARSFSVMGTFKKE